MPFTHFKNIVYPLWRIVHKPMSAYARFEYPAQRWRDPRTGRFITQARAQRIRRTVAYWNRIRSIVRAHEKWSFEDAREALAIYKADYPELTVDQKHSAQVDMWGYWVGV